MVQENLEQQINNLVEEIQSLPLEGTDEEIKLQQILYFDKYVKDNIDYGFEALNFSISNPYEKNPYEIAFRPEGFFKVDENTGSRLAVCGSISQIAKNVFNKLGIACDYVWGHFNIGSKEQPVNIGHRWNIVSINGKEYMLDFTADLIIHNMNKNKEYQNSSQLMFGNVTSDNDLDYLFFDKLASKQTIGGFKKDEQEQTIDDVNEYGELNNTTNNPLDVYPNLSSIPKELLNEYINISQNRVL